MAKKFLTFIGATKYDLTEYYFEGDKTFISSPTHYVQAAIFEKVLTDWGKEDSVYIFTTKDAYKYNYKNRIIDSRTKEVQENEGLEQVFTLLKEQDRIGDYQAFEIPDGNNESEIWAIFQTIYDTLSPDDAIYFDITNGFRSLPMLGVVLIDYAKTLINIHPKHIFYGNFEAGRADKLPTDKYVKAPVINITSVVNLQSWTTAARAFLKGGNTTLLTELTAKSNPFLSENLDNFSRAILTCRGQELNRALDIEALKTQILQLQSQEIQAQLRPLLEKIEEKIRPFDNKNTLNGIRAVEWCITNGLIQQGYTFLQETLKSYIIERVFHNDTHLEDYLLNHSIREAANYALNGSNAQAIGKKLLQNGVQNGIQNNVMASKFVTENTQMNISMYYKDLTAKGRGLRNDINHCGFRKNYASPQDLINELSSLLQAIKSALHIQ